ncbi:MAG: SLC13 family permease [Sedimenticolaceae bacterium]
MGWEALLTLAVVAACFFMMALSRVSPDIIMTAGLTVLLLSGVLSPQEGLAGFANQGMLTVAVLYVVVSGLTETGAIGWIVQHILGQPRDTHRAQVRMMIPAAALSAFLNNTPVVAVFVPAVKVWARRNGLSLSKLLIPLSYASILGGTCTLIGTSTNLVVNGLLVDQVGLPGLGMFDLTWIGLPVAVTALLFVLAFSGRLLPDRQEPLVHGDSLREYMAEMTVEQGSALQGCSIEKAGLRSLPGLFLAEIERDGAILPAVGPGERLQANDRLIFVGAIESVVDLHRIRGLIPATDQVLKLEGARKDRSFFEAVVSDTCPLVGKSVREGRFRTLYRAAIIAVARNGERLRGKIGDMVLRAGDTLLVEARPDFVSRQGRSRDFLLVSEIGGFHPPDHRRAPLALAIIVCMVVLASSGLLSMLEAALVAAGLMLVSGCTSAQVARQSPDWQVLVVIATSFGIGAAMQNSGAAGMLADSIIGLAGGNPWSTLALVFATTALLSAVATNNVAAVLSFPIALSAAAHMNVDVMPFAVTIMMAASASFATPIGYQTNLMVYNAGGYRFADFMRIGLPLTLLVGLLTVGLVPFIWQF